MVTSHGVAVPDHAMHASLYKYLLGRIHPEIRDRQWSRILIRGLYMRSGKSRISPTEKRDKPFNWQRPTAIRLDDSTLEVACFPGQDYVKHYATAIATYLSLNGNGNTIVQYDLPSESECMAPLLDSNLAQMGPVDVVVVGYVHHLDRILKGSWEGGNSENNQIFAWQKLTTLDGRTVSFLGCMVSFWGDISGRLVSALQRLNNVKCVLYVGKAGSLYPKYAPNRWIATGDCSWIDGQLVAWDNVLKRQTDGLPVFVNGTHTTVSSPLDESKAWFESWKNIAEWVDCEVGHMAQASIKGGTSFGYLHIISDNLADSYPHDLSNERLEEVVRGRKSLFEEIQNALESFLGNGGIPNPEIEPQNSDIDARLFEEQYS
jgi:hypothetical protein